MKFYRRLQAFDAVSFDLDDTLYDNWPVIARAEAALTDYLSEHCPPIAALDQATLAGFPAAKHVITNPEQRFDVTAMRVAQLTLTGEFVGFTAEQARAQAQAATAFFCGYRSDFAVPAQSLAYLKAWSATLPLVAITNGNVDTDAIGLTPFFQHIFRAGEHGEPKPSPVMFDKAAQVLDMAPQRILHVGDHLSSDVAGARQAGMQACWIRPERQSPMMHKGRTLPDVAIDDLSELDA
ncbi:HAD-IA family hydrolase [Salinivibrio socompensis]|uniref:HAD-IA family hydrolase n=1 Tax=Salinivibrio socompensis TaxID=1510206 RepID=UPI00047195BA|nr:HAD-IA family hydrolase [Salinivibrio socompensis]